MSYFFPKNPWSFCTRWQDLIPRRRRRKPESTSAQISFVAFSGIKFLRKPVFEDHVTCTAVAQVLLTGCRQPVVGDLSEAKASICGWAVVSYSGPCGEIKEYGVSSYLSHKYKRKMEKIWCLMVLAGKFRQRHLSQRRLKPNYVNTKAWGEVSASTRWFYTKIEGTQQFHSSQAPGYVI